MNDQPDLFAGIPAMKSPRLRWMDKHGITTRFKVSSQGVTWFAEMDEGEKMIQGSGITEDDALFNLAKKRGLTMWNEL